MPTSIGRAAVRSPFQSCGTAGRNDGRTRISDDTIANVSAKALPWEGVEEGD